MFPALWFTLVIYSKIMLYNVLIKKDAVNTCSQNIFTGKNLF